MLTASALSLASDNATATAVDAAVAAASAAAAATAALLVLQASLSHPPCSFDVAPNSDLALALVF
jgi:hypothetical protein